MALLTVADTYVFIIPPGSTPAQFERMATMAQVRSMLSDLDRKKDLALLCINDDVTEDHAEITSYFRGWQEKRWGEPAAWEATRLRWSFCRFSGGMLVFASAPKPVEMP